MSSKTSTTGVALREPFEEETPPGEQLGLLEVRAPLERQELGDARSDPRAFLGVFDGALESGVELRPRRFVVLALGDACAHPDHLGERPVRHAVAVGQAAAAVPGHVLGDAVEVLVELPGEPRLADAGDAGDREQMRLVLVGAGVEELLREPQLAVAADERRLEALRLQSAGPTGGHAESTPELHRLRLALQLVETRVGVRDRRFRCPPCRIADEHRVRIGCTLHTRGRVDEVARDHALPCGAEVDGRLAGQHRRASAELRHPRLGAERAHGGDELERRAYGALGVVLLRHGRAPDGHHRIADELLDDAAVPRR